MFHLLLACAFRAAALCSAAEETRTIRTRHLDLHYEFPGYDSLEAWEGRAADLRRHILVSTGLWPLPEKPPLRPEVYGRVERDGYSVEKAFFQSHLGFLVTGNLYRPLGKKGPFAGVISPHGHWSVGRRANEERGSVPGRCINLARQGHVVFTYDMIGYNDSKQLTHKFGGQREELWGLSLLGLQLWGSMRAIDFLLTLPEVDPQRIGCTGASGGGTQTFMVMSVDDRVKVAAPVNMVSAYMQGGCLCENAPNLRVDTFNTEIAALMAPRPLLLVSATGDWTKNNPTEEAPDIRSIYALYGAEEKFDCVQFDAPHNYNQDSREAVYAWFGRWLLGIDDAGALKEQPFQVEKDEDLLVFADRDLPEYALDEHGLVESLIQASEDQLESYRPQNRQSLKRFREVYGSSLRHCLNLDVPGADQVETVHSETVRTEPWEVVQLTLARQGSPDRVPATLVAPRGAEQAGPVVVVASDRPRRELLPLEEGQPHPVVQGLIDKGRAALLIDCFLVGDSQLSEDSERNLDVKYFTTYNRTDTALRVQDIVTALVYARDHAGKASVSLVGMGEAGLWSLLASAAASRLAAVAADMAGLDANSDEQLMNRLFTPGLRRAGDVRTAAALWAPARLLVHNTGSGFAPELAEAAYEAAKAPKKLELRREAASAEEIVKWVAPRKVRG